MKQFRKCVLESSILSTAINIYVVDGKLSLAGYP